MSPRSFVLLVLATGASVALAVSAVVQQERPQRSVAAGEALFPGLLDRLNDVHEIAMVGPEGTLTVRAQDGGWRLAEKSGYPVPPERVRALALGVAGLELVEAKTADPARLPRLELEEPAGEGAKSRRIELRGGDGEPIAAAVVGKASPSLYGGGRGGVYVRRAGEDQAWLAAGELELPSDAMDLLDPEVLDLPLAEVAQVTLVRAGEPVLALTRGDESADFASDATLPEGRKLDPVKIEALAGALAGLRMSDLRPAGTVPAAADAPRGRFESFDGLVVTATLSQQGEGEDQESWLVLAAEVAAAPVEPPNEDAGGPNAQERAAAITAATAGWAFQIPGYLAERFDDRLEDLLAEPTPGS